MNRPPAGRKQRLPDKLSGIAARIDETLSSQASVLDLSRQGATKLPHTIANLGHLQELNLSGNQLTELPECIGQLSGLKKLNLSGNQLTELPECISQMTRLQELIISDNRITALPECIDRLSKLKHLYVSNNRLTALPESIGRLTYLEMLHVSSNQLTSIPESVSQLVKLQCLDIPLNKLVKLPESICRLAQLEYLDISDNQITALPECIDRLSKLKHLYVSNNRLTVLPESIGRLTKLQSLHLQSNQLISLPDSLLNLKALEIMFLHENDLLGLPAEVLGPNRHDIAVKKGKPAKPDEILQYYLRLRDGSRPLNEAKLILVGRGEVGKTSLVKRLVYDQFKSKERKTEGIKITEWQLRLQGSDNVRLNVWDFGGQEIMHATHQFFLTQRSLYILVLNGRGGSEDADAEYWLKLIESFGGDSPVIIVLNKIKEHPFDVNRRALQQKYPIIRDFIKTDCADRTGLYHLRKIIEQETDRLEHLRDAFPASWFAIKERLAGMKKNFLSFDLYRRICANLGEKNSSAQESLAFYLHSLGIALNYKDDPRLQDTHVLNPHWVTNGIYGILNSEILEKQKGEISLSDVCQILNEKRYPPKMHCFLFDLMKKFDLCFSFPDNDSHFLIPALLDKQEPQETSQFNPERCLNFQYHYTVLPEGLLPRFIVRTNVLSEGLGYKRWRTGVILDFEGSRALVKADIQDKNVFIHVSGSLPSRRRLLAIIRADFERIHNDIRNLKPQQMIPLPNNPDVVIPYEELLIMERDGVQKFLRVVKNRTLELDVYELLNGVDLEGLHRRIFSMNQRAPAVRLFYSYSHKDESLRNQLETHLKLLQREGLVELWHDRKIEAGDDWKQQIDDNLERADIILLLVSANFMASDYCYEVEMRRALERHEGGLARVIPIIVRDVNWGGAPFANLQALPRDGKAVTKWPNKDSAWRNVSEGIARTIEELRNKSGKTV